MELEEQKRRRRKRINRLKRMILWTVAFAILVPSVIAICFGLRLHSLKSYTGMLEEQTELLLKENGRVQTKYDQLEALTRSMADVVNGEEASNEEATKEDGKAGAASEKEEEPRRVYLTFDDGPSPVTNDILDMLKKYEVKATFFVVGKTEPQYDEVYQRIVEEGHTLGMHSFSHQYEQIYSSEEAFAQDIQQLRDFLKEKTGVECKFSRFPGGSSNSVSQVEMSQLVAYLEEQGITYFDWNMSSRDSSSTLQTKEQIFYHCVAQLADYHTAVILFHDAPEKKTTVEALPEIIEAIQAMENTVLLPITEETKLIQHIKKEREE